MRLLWLLILISTQTYAESSIEKFANNKCTHSHQSSWRIVSKLDTNLYEITFATIGPHKNWGRAVLKLNSVSFDSKGAVDEMIFVQVKEKMSVTDKEGFKRMVDLLQESAECKKLWLDHDFHEDSKSYPRLGEETIKSFRVKNKIKQEKISKATDSRLSEERVKEIKRIDDSLLKTMSPSGLKDFRSNNCIKLDNYKYKMGAYNNSKYDYFYLVADKQRGVTGFWEDIPKIEGYAKENSDFLIKSSEVYEGHPVYVKSSKCKSIYKNNPSNSIIKKNKNRKKREALYE